MKMASLLRRLRTETNGAVVGSMEERGVSYTLSYGVALPAIKAIAAEYAPDHALALHLFRQGIRELKIAAVYIADPSQVTPAQMQEWVDSTPGGEIVRHIAMGLFYASPFSAEVAAGWLNGADGAKTIVALHIAGRRAVKGLSDAKEAKSFITIIARGLKEKRISDVGSSTYALCKLASVEGMEQRVRDEIGELKKCGIATAENIADEVEALMGWQ